MAPEPVANVGLAGPQLGRDRARGQPRLNVSLESLSLDAPFRRVLIRMDGLELVLQHPVLDRGRVPSEARRDRLDAESASEQYLQSIPIHGERMFAHTLQADVADQLTSQTANGA